jgi:ribosomal protein S18 acetylase RimI-like enzyme
MSAAENPKLPVHIRLATAGDVPAIIRVVNAAFAIETFIDGTRTDEERMAEMLRKGEFLVAEEGGRIMASVYVERRGQRGYFGMLAVDPASQGKGLGRAMVQAAESYCQDRGCFVMDLAVLSLRPELLPLYQKLGYVKTGTEEFHPSRPLKDGFVCHVIIMSKKL